MSIAIEYKDNNKMLLKILADKRSKLNQALISGARVGMQNLSGQIIKSQMTGRPGLNVGTGNLRRSWFVTVVGSGIDTVVKLATRTKYAAIHQYGGRIKPKIKNYLKFKIGEKYITTKQVTIPKRLNIIESFKKDGYRYISDAIEKKLQNVLKPKGAQK